MASSHAGNNELPDETSDTNNNKHGNGDANVPNDTIIATAIGSASATGAASVPLAQFLVSPLPNLPNNFVSPVPVRLPLTTSSSAGSACVVPKHELSAIGLPNSSSSSSTGRTAQELAFRAAENAVRLEKLRRDLMPRMTEKERFELTFEPCAVCGDKASGTCALLTLLISLYSHSARRTFRSFLFW